MKNIILIITAIFISAAVYAQPSDENEPDLMRSSREGSLKGKIVEKSTNKGMEFSSVAIYDLRDSSLLTGTISGTDGDFIIKNMPYGRYYIVANFMGFEKSVINDISISPRNKNIDIGIIQLDESTEKIDEVEIIAQQAHVEYKLDRKVINVGQDINAETGTAAQILENTPSVNVDIDGNVTMRGSGNFTVLIDGKPSPLSGSDALQQIPASAVRNIEIITNPSAKFDPDGMAGIINIISKKSALLGMNGIVNASIGTGDKYTTDFLLNYKMDKLNVFVGGSYRDQIHAGSFESSKTLISPESGMESYDLMYGSRNRSRFSKEIKGGFDYSFNDNTIFSLSGEVGSYESGHGGKNNQRLYDELLSFDNYLISDNYNTHGGDYYNLNTNFTRKFDKPGHELVAFINYSFSNGRDTDRQIEYDANSEYIIESDAIPLQLRTGEEGTEHEIKAQIDYTRPIGEFGKLEAGYQFRFDDEVETYLFEDYDPDLNEWINNEDYSSSIDFYRAIQAVYTTYGNKLGNFQYQLGLRGEYTDREVTNAQSVDPKTVNRFDLFPTLHISRQFNNNHQLMASYSRRINRPRGWYLEEFLTYMNSTTLRKGNSGLLPEYMNSYELGYQKSFGRSFFAFETYYKNTVNKIERVQEIYDQEERIFLMTFENISKDHSLGLEGMINFAQLKWMNINASSSVYRYWIEGEINGVEINTRSNNWNLRLNTSFNISTKTRLQLTTMYNGPSVTAQGERGSFFFSNVALKQEFFDRKLSATLQLRDIFGTMRYNFESNGVNFNSNFEYAREPQVITLSLSYKINNYKQKRGEGGQGEGAGEGEMF